MCIRDRINTEIKDSVKTVIKKEAIDFKEELKLNPLTTIIAVSYTHLDVDKRQQLFIILESL